MEKNLVINQIKSTMQLISSIDQDDDLYLPNLLNCLLSLVVLPVEDLKKKPREKIFGSSFKEFQKKTGIDPLLFNPIKCVNKGRIEYNRRTPQKFVEKLRNGIAHQNISIKEFEGNQYIIIYNKFNKIKDFEIKITPRQLKRLAVFIGNSYLKSNWGMRYANRKSNKEVF